MSVSDMVGEMAQDRAEIPVPPSRDGNPMEPPSFPHLANINGQRGSTPEEGAAPPAPHEYDEAPLHPTAKQQKLAEVLAGADMMDSLDVEFAMKSREGKENGSGDAPSDSYVRDLASASTNEVFGDDDMEFLANAGSANTTDSDLARQSLYQKFDPFVPASAVPAAPKAPPRPGPADAIFKQPFPVQSSTATTDMIVAMQQKRDAIMKQQQPASEGKQMQFAGLELAQPHSWPDERNNNNTTAPFVNFKISPKATPPMSQPRHQTQTLDNPLNGEHGDLLMNGDGALSVEEEESLEQPIPAYDAYPPGSLVNFATPPQRPVTLRAKNTSNKMTNINKTMHRRSVPANVFAERENLNMALGAEQQGGDYAGLPDLPPLWENVVAMYEGVVQTLLAKLKTFQEETACAKQREARAIADQEEMHRVFVSLHERFETSKTVITTYKSNQEVLQKAFDELNADFAPMQHEMKRLQAANRLNELKVRQLESDLEKKREENAEMGKIVDELISGTREG